LYNFRDSVLERAKMSKKEIIELTKVEINYLYNLVIDNIREEVIGEIGSNF
jgi:hypothetical protein